jgi:hypothetical protein
VGRDGGSDAVVSHISRKTSEIWGTPGLVGGTDFQSTFSLSRGGLVERNPVHSLPFAPDASRGLASVLAGEGQADDEATLWFVSCPHFSVMQAHCAVSDRQADSKAPSGQLSRIVDAIER